MAFDYFKNFVNFINVENEGDSSRLGKILILVGDREMVELILFFLNLFYQNWLIIKLVEEHIDEKLKTQIG